MPDKPNLGQTGRRLSEQEALNVQTGWPGDKPYADPLFQAGDSPAVHDILGDTKKNAHGGYLVVDPSDEVTPALGDISVKFAEGDGSTYGEARVIKNGEVVSLEGRNIAKVEITHLGTNCGYRLVAEKLYRDTA